MTSVTTSRGQEWRYHNLLFVEDFMNKSTEATPEDANHSSLARRIGDKLQKFWDKVLWADFMDQSDGKAKVWRKKDLLMIPNIQAHLKHSGGNVMAWAFIASSGTGSLIFINDVTNDGSSKINSEIYRNILSWQFTERCNQTDCEILHHAAR